MFKWLKSRMERGQAIIEYMPTIAGAMVVTTVTLVTVGGGVTNSYCEIVDAVGERPEMCESIDDTGDDGDAGEEGTDGDAGESPDDSTDDPGEPSCVVTLDSAEGEYPSGWNTTWEDGEPDTLRVTVGNLAEPITWSLKRRFPTDPDSEDTEIASGEFFEDGEHTIDLSYPPEGEWGPVSTDGYGVYEVHDTLHIADPCDDKGWDRWYTAPWTADLGIEIEHATSPVEQEGETLTYRVTVTNHGPMAAQIYNDQGAVVTLPVPPDVTVVSVNPSKGTCDTQIVCDLGEMAVYESATIDVETTVDNPFSCDLTGATEVSAPRPPDPNNSNDSATTIPFCELVCPPDLAPSFSLVNADTGNVIDGDLQNGEEIIDPGVNFGVVMDVDGAGSVFMYGEGDSATYNTPPYRLGNWNTVKTDYWVAYEIWAAPDRNAPICTENGIGFDIIEAPEPACEMNVDSLELVDADFDQSLGQINDGATFELDPGQNISVVANVSGSVESVRFYVNGSEEQTESQPPYAIAGDNNGDYNAWNVATGSSYTVRAVPYAGNSARGETCSEYEVTFTLTEAADDPPPDEDPESISDPDQPTEPKDDPIPDCPSGYHKIAEYNHYESFNQTGNALKACNCDRNSHTYHFTLANDSDVVIVAAGAVGHPENGCPENPTGQGKYCDQPNQPNERWELLVDGTQVGYYPDNDAIDHVYLRYPDIDMGTMSAGTYEVIMRHPDKSGGQSVAAYAAVCTQSEEEPQTCDATIDSFSWVNTYTGAISPLNDGDEISVDLRDSISVIANTSGTVGSVTLNGAGVSRTDNDAVYSLTPTSGSSYEPLNMRSGAVTVSAEAYGEADAGGDVCDTRTVSFTLVEDPTPDHTVANPPCPASHPNQVVAFDIMPQGQGDHLNSLIGNNKKRRQSSTKQVVLNQRTEIVLVASGSVGHPELDCPQSGHQWCNQVSQVDETWEVWLNNEKVAFYPDSPTYHDVYLAYPNTYMTLDEGSYPIYIRHSYFDHRGYDSVGAVLRVCTD